MTELRRHWGTAGSISLSEVTAFIDSHQWHDNEAMAELRARHACLDDVSGCG